MLFKKSKLKVILEIKVLLILRQKPDFREKINKRLIIIYNENLQLDTNSSSGGNILSGFAGTKASHLFQIQDF